MSREYCPHSCWVPGDISASVVCTENAREFSDMSAISGFEDSLWFRAGSEQIVTEGIGSKGLTRADKK